MARWRGASATLAIGALLWGWTPGVFAQAGAAPVLSFAKRGKPVRTLELRALQASATPVIVTVHEPYEDGEARFVALSFTGVLDEVYGPGWREEEELLFTCADGYQPTLPVRRVIDHRAWLAFDRRSASGGATADGFSILKHESGERKRVELAPFYLVWENIDDPQVLIEGDYGWPYQLVGVDLIRTRDRFPHMVPPQDASPEALAGFSAFRMHCSRCHQINGEGGAIGPELNRSLGPLDLREDEWLRRWIDDPSGIQPNTRMPRLNLSLPDRAETIDHILAYLRVMASERGPRPAPPAPTR